MTATALKTVRVGIPNIFNYRYMSEMRKGMAHDNNVRWDSIFKFHISELDSDSNSIEGLEKAAYKRLCKSGDLYHFIVVDNESLNLLRILHKHGRIALEVTFYDIAACDRNLPVTDTPPAIGKKVDIAPNGRLSAWPPSVLDALDELLDQVLD